MAANSIKDLEADVLRRRSMPDELEPIKLQPAGPTYQARYAATEILRRFAGDAWAIYVDEAAELIDKEMGLKKLIGEYNDLVLRFEDEHEMRLRLQADLKLLKEKHEKFLKTTMYSPEDVG